MCGQNENARTPSCHIMSRVERRLVASFSSLFLFATLARSPPPTYTNREKRKRDRQTDRERVGGREQGWTNSETLVGSFIKRASNYYCDKRNARRSTSTPFKSPGDAQKANVRGKRGAAEGGRAEVNLLTRPKGRETERRASARPRDRTRYD